MDKVVVVTGGSRGIGRAIAQRFLEDNDKVIIVSTNETDGKKAEAELCKYGCCEWYKADIAKENECKVFVEYIVDKYSTIDILINNAARIILPNDKKEYCYLLDIDIDRMKENIDINVIGYVNMIKYVSRVMCDVNKGTIINMGSVSGAYAVPSMMEYCVSKAAVSMVSKCVACELSDYDIRCITVLPGLVENKKLNRERFPYHIGEKLIKTEEIAEIVFWATTENAKLLNGTEINANYGFSSFMESYDTSRYANIKELSGYNFRSRLNQELLQYNNILIFGTASEAMVTHLYTVLSNKDVCILCTSSIYKVISKNENCKLYEYKGDRFDAKKMIELCRKVQEEFKPDCVLIACGNSDMLGYDNVIETAELFDCDKVIVNSSGSIKKMQDGIMYE